MELRNLWDKISADGQSRQQPRRFPAGVSYRSLCSRCNSELLGVLYDPALAEFSASVRDIGNGPPRWPNAVPVTIQPQAVMRSTLGHLCAQGVERYLKGPLTESIRDYMLDTTLPLPAGIRIYFWIYPNRSQVLIRDAVRSENLGSGGPAIAFWLMKFYPLAFMVTLTEPAGHQYNNLANMDAFRHVPFTQQGTVFLSLNPMVRLDWPENPQGEAAILYGQQAMAAEPII